MKHLLLFLSLFLGFYALGQDLDSEISRFAPLIRTLHDFSKYIPQEKVYLHFDNTSYYQGDPIWFKCYVVTSAQHQLSPLSKTLYVELLNPGGEVVDTRILKIENGQCHGDFTLNQLPFYSGFYEVRAYTKYMLNFGDDVVFSRLLPVFGQPKTEGNFEEKEMLRYGAGDYPMKRERPLKGKDVNFRFFPEGGHPVQGVASRVAFEATDEAGNPIDVTGVVTDDKKRELCRFASLHEGRGVFTYTPGAGKRKDVAEVEYSGKKYRFALPAGLPQGVVMEVDNLACPDSVGIVLRKNKETPSEMLGVAIITGGSLRKYSFAWIENDEVRLPMAKTQLPPGVSQIVLFNSKGEILCDRLIFAGKIEGLDMKAKTGKPVYRPYEQVEMEISVADREANPVRTIFSLSVRDGANEVESGYNILTDLLLMSEIKGYVRNPFYYFEADDDTRRAALDLLLMVQGWRRYSWKRMAGTEPFEISYLPEEGIETRGKIVTSVRQRPRPDVDVSMFLQKNGEGGGTAENFVESFVTDDQGRFSFVSDVAGRWNMILGVTEKGKARDHLILLDKVFSLEPRRYRYADLQVNVTPDSNGHISDEEMPGPSEAGDFESFFAAYKDSLARSGTDEKVLFLPELTVRSGRRTKEQAVYHNRSTSVAYYDMASEMDDIYDRGEYIGRDIHEMLKSTNPDFSVRIGTNNEFLYYKNKRMFFVVDYEPTTWDELGYFKYRNIPLGAIKSMYINEYPSVMAQYIYSPDPMVSPLAIAFGLGCAVFIETYPEGQVPAESAKGVRKTWLEGYSAVSEFYSPDYSALPPEPDYRRTLYWNPAVTTDEAGHAGIRFYNNSRCTNFSISAETVTPQGAIGIFYR